jgi:hypothetical protein
MVGLRLQAVRPAASAAAQSDTSAVLIADPRTSLSAAPGVCPETAGLRRHHKRKF